MNNISTKSEDGKTLHITIVAHFVSKLGNAL